MDPTALGIVGSTQPELFQGTIDAIAARLLTDASAFWTESLAKDGPIEIWHIDGQRFLYNGNHRFHAAVLAGCDIPPGSILLVDKPGCAIPVFLLCNVVCLPGRK